MESDIDESQHIYTDQKLVIQTNENKKCEEETKMENVTTISEGLLPSYLFEKSCVQRTEAKESRDRNVPDTIIEHNISS